MSEFGVRIPVITLLREGADLRILREAAKATDSRGIRVLGVAEYPSLVTGIRSTTVRIILNYFELTNQLISDSFVVFPPSSQAFPEDVITRAKAIGLEPMEVPGFTGIPKLIGLLERREIDLDHLYMLWPYVAPRVPIPVEASLERISTRYHSFFLATTDTEDRRLSVVEEDGQTPYVPRLDEPRYILAEAFPDPREPKSPRDSRRPVVLDPNSGILEMLGINRVGVSRLAVQAAVMEKGPEVLSWLGLNPDQFQVHPIRYEDYLRVGNNLDWGQGPLITYMYGWAQDKGRLLPLLAGRSLDSSSRLLTGFHDGLSAYFVPNDYWVNKIMEEEGLDNYMVRIAVSRRPSMEK